MTDAEHTELKKLEAIRVHERTNPLVMEPRDWARLRVLLALRDQEEQERKDGAK